MSVLKYKGRNISGVNEIKTITAEEFHENEAEYRASGETYWVVDEDGTKGFYPAEMVSIDEIEELEAENAQEAFSSLASSVSDLNASLVNFDGAGFHNCIYRGKYLGASVTAEQYSRIADGTFKDLYIGDYWTIGDVNYRIASFDYYLKSGDTECTTHHAVIVPDTNLGDAQMNASNVTTGAYVGSAMYKTNIAPFKANIKNAFGASHILTHREYLKNAVTNGYESGGSWYDSDIELMTEQMAYGTSIFANAVAGTSLAAKHTVSCKQLNLFRHRPDLISNRNIYWLRDVANASSFAHVNSYGTCNYHSASTSFGVRPSFCIKG